MNNIKLIAGLVFLVGAILAQVGGSEEQAVWVFLILANVYFAASFK